MAERPTIPELRKILGKLQVPSEEYSEIQPGLIMGAITSAKDTALLTKLGVTHIINCAYDPTGKGNFIYVDTNEVETSEKYIPMMVFYNNYWIWKNDCKRNNCYLEQVLTGNLKMIEKTPLAELRAIMGKCQVPTVDYTVIQPGLILGGITTARDTALLTKVGVTHIVNCAYDPTGKGNFIYVASNEEYYKQHDFKCEYLGVRAADTARFNLSKFFHDVADFIENAIKSNGVVYVHCYMAISRSAALTIAYFMIKQNMTLKEAVIFIRNKREIFPNDGFMQQLLELEKRLERS